MLSIRSLFKRKNNSGNNFRITRLDETDSTNAYIRRMLSAPQQGETDPVADQSRYWVVTTEFQSSGRGQGTNTWESERGKNLLFSVLCHPVWIPITGQFILSEAIALAIRDALAVYDSHFTIKWPNDIYWNDKKICGILIENTLGGGHIKDCILGVGLNVNQNAFHSDAPVMTATLFSSLISLDFLYSVLRNTDVAVRPWLKRHLFREHTCGMACISGL